jgi:hypothetical protein
MNTNSLSANCILAPNGNRVRLAAGGAVFFDFGAAMGFSGSYAHKLLATHPPLHGLLRKAKVGSRVGYIADCKAVEALLAAVDAAKAGSPNDRGSLEAFSAWARTTLIPAIRALDDQAPAPSGPGRFRITADGVDFRLNLPDLARMAIEIERPGLPKLFLSGDSLFQN